jgi:predicted phage terminase large subunit-like protein
MVDLFDPHDLAALSEAQLDALIDGLPDGMIPSLAETLGATRGDLPTLLEVDKRVATDWHDRDHITHIAQVLEDAVAKVEAGQSVGIIISLPPGSAKSTLASVALPLWIFAKHPDWNIGGISAGDLANRWSRLVRRHIQEGKVPVTLAPDTQTITEWDTAERGKYIARGINGQITGSRLHVAIIDDPTKSFAEAASPVHRNSLWDLWTGVVIPRMHPAHLTILIQTRWHQDDLAGRMATNHPDFINIVIPAIAETNDPLGRAPGEPLLSPQRAETPDEALERWASIKAAVGTAVWEALYQQHPSPPGGRVFNEKWWQWHNDSNRPAENVGDWLTSWDLNYGTEDPDTGDYVVGTIWQKHEGRCYLIDMVRGRWEFTETIHHMDTAFDRYPQAKVHLIEKAASGAAAISTLRKKFTGVIAVPPEGSKEVRANAVAPMVESKAVSLPQDRDWVGEVLAEVNSFPKGVHDDIVDSLTQALKRMQDPHTATLYTPNAGPGALPSAQGLAAMRRGGY